MGRWRLSRPFQRSRRIFQGRPEVSPSVEARIQLLEAMVTAELHDRSRADREWVEARILASEAMLAVANPAATLPPVLEAVEARAVTLLGEMEAMLAASLPAPHQPVLATVEARIATLLDEVAALLERRLRAFAQAGERREQDRVASVRASVAEAMTRLMQSTEARMQAVLLEAKSHSDEVGQSLVSGLRSQGRILAAHVKLLDALPKDLVDLPAHLNERLANLEADVRAEHAKFTADVHRIGQDVAGTAADIKADVEARAAHRDADVRAEQAKLTAELHVLRQDVAGSGDNTAGFEARAAQLDAGIRADYNQQLRNVEGRLEFVRREIMYELQASLLRLGQQGTAPERFQPKVLSPDKLKDQLETGLKLNIGCGHIPLEGYINVDRRDLPGVDIVAEATAVPLDPGMAREIIASHLVEHFSLRTLEDVVLPHWHDLLAPGGQLTLVAPDGAAMVSAVADGSMTFEAFREVLFGAQEYDGDFHFNLLTTDTVSASLARSGFEHVTVEYAARRNGLCYEFRIAASRAASP